MAKPGKNCWLKRGKKKDNCKAIKHSQLSGTASPSEKIAELGKLTGLDKQTNNQNEYQPGIFNNETFDSTLDLAQTNASEGSAMYHRSYVHPILKHSAKI